MALPTDISQAYRRRTLALRAATYRDLLKLWPAFDPNNPDAFTAWMMGANAVALRDYRRAESLAAEYLPLHAVASGVDALQVRPAEAFPADRVETSARVTSLVAFRKAIGAGKSREEARRIAYVRSSGALSRHALDGGRSVLMRTAVASPQVAGWRRTGNPQCQWCRELIGRGEVYRSESTADFAAHDHCTCGAENVYTGEAKSVRDFEQSSRFTEGGAARRANNARIRAYLNAL